MSQFTVIIPFWNAADTLAQTLSSVALQSLRDFRVIMIDDGSTDRSPEIARAFEVFYPQFRLVRTDNGGPGAARNMAAFSVEKGGILAFLDADDVWSRDRLQRIAEVYDANPRCDAVYTKVGFFRSDPEITRTQAVESRSTIVAGDLTIKDLLRSNPVCTMSNIAVRADAFVRTGGFKPDLRYAEDVEWMVRLIAGGGRIVGLDEMHLFYRTSDEGQSSHLMAMQEGWRETLQTVRSVDPMLTDADIAAAEASHLRYLARRALRLRTPRGTALSMAARGLRASPRGFFADPKRAALTLVAATGEAIMPRALRHAVFVQ